MEMVCLGCGLPFTPHHSVSNQRYCGRRECQNARKNAWRKRAQDDPEHRANQAAARKRWQTRNPGYFREYRRTHPEYVARNRQKQRERARRLRAPSTGESSSRHLTFAKRDELGPLCERIAGDFRVIPVTGRFVRSDELIVRLERIPGVSG